MNSEVKNNNLEHKSRWWKRNLNFPYTTKEFLNAEYVINKKPSTQIAQEQHTTSNTIRRWLNIHNIPRHPHYEYYRVNLLGKKFGKLMVISEYKSANNQGIKWKCQCDCGNEIIVKGKFLTKGDRTNCGCTPTNFNGYKEISGTFFNRIKRHAKTREITFNITITQIWELFLKQNRRCALSNDYLYLDANSENEEVTASLDRIDSSKGYTIDNIQWVHKDLNRCKWDFSEEEFLKWVAKIYDYRISQHQ